MSARSVALGRAESARAEAGSSWREPVQLNPALACLAQSRRVLLLQGPVGPFFDRLTLWLRSRECEVRRVAFHGGDERDCKAVAPILFDQPAATWSSYLGQLIAGWQPDCLALFGQARLYHKAALERARAMDLPVVVVEEGYFRPGYVTMELGGVNGYSTTLDRFEWHAPVDGNGRLHHLTPHQSRAHFQKMAWHASQHYIALHEQRQRFPHYQHHRSDDAKAYARYWIRSWWRKGWHRAPDRRLQRWLIDSRQPYFFVPLQLEGDSQLTHHSSFRGNVTFVLRVLQSFAANAPAGSLLVFRQHPHARGAAGHAMLIRTVAAGLGILHRVHHMVEGDTPDLAEHSMGTVVINSTVGLQALERGVPLIALGDALYNQPHLTYQDGLDAFWTQRTPPDPSKTGAFLAQLKHLTQAPASVYALRSEPLAWSALIDSGA